MTFLEADALEHPRTVMNEAIWRDQCPLIALHSAKQMGYPFSRDNMKRNPEKIPNLPDLFYLQRHKIVYRGEKRISKMLICSLDKFTLSGIIYLTRVSISQGIRFEM